MSNDNASKDSKEDFLGIKRSFAGFGYIVLLQQEDASYSVSLCDLVNDPTMDDVYMFSDYKSADSCFDEFVRCIINDSGEQGVDLI